jgi:hypothetical protein
MLRRHLRLEHGLERAAYFAPWRLPPENTYLMRLAGRFSRRIRGYAKAHGIPVIDCSVGQRKHELAEEYLAKTTVTQGVTQGLFLVLVGRAQAPVWDVGAKHHIERKKPMPPASWVNPKNSPR